MKHLIYFTIVLLLTACSKDDKIVDSSGTRLISIEHTLDNATWMENYSYSSNSELNRIEDFYLLGRRYEISYENNQLKEYSTFRIDDDKFIFRDSILYNDNGTIKAIYNFSLNAGENLPLSWIYEFEYDDENKVSKKSTYFVAIQDYTSIEKYYWEGDNIERVEYHNGDEALYYEYFYKYDDKVNYKKDLPTEIKDPINWCVNNVVEMDWNDYLGNLDIICRPCPAEYQYNLNDYPVSIKTNLGRNMNLNYE